MIIKGNKETNEIDGYPIISEYYFLGITFTDKM